LIQINANPLDGHPVLSPEDRPGLPLSQRGAAGLMDTMTELNMGPPPMR
jgi:hypothetical protein